MGSFVERTPDAGSYRGELLGLMAIHLILQSINDVSTGLRGSVHIYSDCLGALYKVENLLPYRIPTQCSHSGILKNIMVNCSQLSLTRFFLTQRPIRTIIRGMRVSRAAPNLTAKWTIMQRRLFGNRIRIPTHPLVVFPWNHYAYSLGGTN